MADRGTRAIIELVGGGKIETPETPDELERLVGRGATLLKVEDINGLRHWVNPAQITEFYEPDSPDAA